ncbi:MAG: hypothetical protein GDA43_20755 [Hormoscilla sp. SP5CHS1]|nr:hypothetical protein [Hormoscilla sp. SP12CHS1]MBC6455330.1 hypothetical protein [Hormoscilla sp. SP5CHS1]MBC6474022.1 hypothetical protein [Hormoscilla sp. GM102CHS1]
MELENYWAWYQRGLVLSELGQMRRSLALTGRSTGNLIGSRDFNSLLSVEPE